MTENPRRTATLALGLGITGAALGLAGTALLGAAVAGAARRYRRRHNDLDGRVALITGGSRGLGFALAEEFLRNGCHVAICARDEAELEAARQKLESRALLAERRIVTLACDIADRVQVDAMIDYATQQLGRIDILVNDAGIIQVGPLESQTLQDFHDAMNINFWGAVHCTLAILPQMLSRRSGRIVNITSIGGVFSVPHLLPYSCSKFALVGFSHGIHSELKGKGVAVTTVIPGLMRTGSHLNAYFKGDTTVESSQFGILASTPGITVPAARAARRIVNAARRKDAQLIVGWPATLACMLPRAMGGFEAEALGLVSKTLSDSGNKELRSGRESGKVPGFSLLTILGSKAARRFNENVQSA
jgi:NAD(P)-dependent dehydrogenase (short-subunit alcohol dehydrogenase family)